jgi:hypothetical protein
MSETTNEPLAEILIRIELLEQKLKNFGDHLFRLSENFMNHREEQSDKFRDAYDRIKNLEVAVFPNLFKDIESVHKIIGGTGVPKKNNPLDRKKTSPNKGPKD